MAQKLIWVDEDQAIRYEQCQSEEEGHKVFDEYIDKVKEESKRDFKANLETLEEDVAIYTGLMLKVKQAFEKAKDEQLSLSYLVWENFEKEVPSIRNNVSKIVKILDPLETKLKYINEQLKKIDTWNIERVINAITAFNDLSAKNKQMFEFLINNFKA